MNNLLNDEALLLDQARVGSTEAHKRPAAEVKCVEKGFKGLSLSDSLSINISIDFFAVLLTVGLSYLIAVYLRGILGVDVLGVGPILNSKSVWMNLLIPLTVVITLSLAWGHYSRQKNFWAESLDVIKAIAYSSTFVFAYSFFFKAHSSRLWMLVSLLLLIVGVPLARFVCRFYLKRADLWDLPVIVIGTKKRIQLVEASLEEEASISGRIVAKVIYPDAGDVHQSERLSAQLHFRAEGMLSKYPNARVLLAFQDPRVLETMPSFMRLLSKKSKKTIIASSLWGLPQAKVEVFSPPSSEMVYLSLAGVNDRPVGKVIKRLFDLLCSFILLVIVSPVMVSLCVLLSIDRGSPIYRSKRIGFGGEVFDCFKFRSMKLESEQLLKNHLAANSSAKLEWETSFKLKNDPRITKTGEFIRKTSLDELPQLFNVLIGEMSLVGPRPLLLDEESAYGFDFVEYIEAKPGITGLWQVSGRSNTSYEKRIELNRWYQRNWSLWLDVVILLKTIPALWPSRDAY